MTDIELERFSLGMAQLIHEDELLQSLHPELIVKRTFDKIAVGIKAHIWGRTQKKIDVKYPADWKQAFKERWFPKWLRNKYPIRYVEFTVIVRAYFPDFVLELPPGDKLKVVVMTMEKRDKGVQ
jgi:hypothetical protein